MENAIAFIKVKVHVYLGSAAMGMCRHRIPDAAGRKLSKPQYDLACIHDSGPDRLVNDALVALFLASHFQAIGFGFSDQLGWIFSVSRITQDIELGGLG